MGILTKIRQRPDHQKKVIALVGAVVLTLIILGAWLGFGQQFKEPVVANGENTLSSVGPFDLIKEELKKIVNQ